MEKYGRLTVLEEHTKFYGGKWRMFFLCQCDCGNIVDVPWDAIKKGKIVSCGCYHNEKNKENKRENAYEFFGDYVIGYSESGDAFCFDLKNYDKIKDYYWFVTPDGYVITKSKGIGWTGVFLHRFILNVSDNMVVDHVDGKRADNREINLRVCFQRENTYNAKKKKNNTSGVTGVYLRKRNGNWVGQIMVGGKAIYLMESPVFEEAVRARLLAEKEYFGEFAPQRYLFSQYGIE